MYPIRKYNIIPNKLNLQILRGRSLGTDTKKKFTVCDNCERNINVYQPEFLDVDS